MKNATHPLVRLIERERGGSVDWYARWRCPDSGKYVDVNLSKIGKTNARARLAWAREKNDVLQARLSEIATGAPRRTQTPLAEVVSAFLDQTRKEKRPDTVLAYAKVCAKVDRWAEGAGLRHVEDIDGTRLQTLRAWLVAQPKRVAQVGAKAGKKREAGARSPAGINSDLTAVRAFVTFLMTMGKLPRLNLDTVRLVMKRLPFDGGRPRFLESEKIRAVLTSCLAHDLAQESAPGKRAQPIAPAVTVALLGGLRVGELCGLTWKAVDLSTGRLVVMSTTSKKREERDVKLLVSPALARLLAVMREHAAPGDADRVFRLDQSGLDSARKRLMDRHGCPAFSWSSKAGGKATLRATCATFLWNADGVPLSFFDRALQLGHAAAVAQKHYAGRVAVPREVTSLEAAMGIADLAELVVRAAGGERIELPGAQAPVDASTVGCPRCRRGAGEVCVRSNGRPLGFSHAGRTAAARSLAARVSA